MQKRVNTAGLRLLSLKSLAYMVDPEQASGNLGFKRVPTIPWEELLTVRNHLYKQWGLRWTPAPSWESGILVCATQRVPEWPALSQNSSTESPVSFPGRQYLTPVITRCRRNRACLVWFPGRWTLAASAWFPPDFALCTFPSADFFFLTSLLEYNCFTMVC